MRASKKRKLNLLRLLRKNKLNGPLPKFRDLVNRNQVQGNERNIDYWRKQGWEAFSTFVQEKSQQKSITQEKRSKVEGRSVVLHEDPKWLIVVPLDKDASCFHGKNTSWCTTKPYASFFEEYFYNQAITLVYVLNVIDGNKWAIAAYPDDDVIECFNKNDIRITPQQFNDQTGFDPAEYASIATKSEIIQTPASESRKIYRQAIERIQQKEPFTEVDPVLEKDLMFTKQFDYTLDYCLAVKGRWPLAERWIARNSSYAVSYASSVIGSPWPEAEKTILRNPIDTMNYAFTFYVNEDDREEDGARLQREWPEGFRVIMSDDLTAVEFASRIMTRFPKSESKIMKHPKAARLYAVQVLKQRWAEAEPYIQQDPEEWEKYRESFKN